MLAKISAAGLELCERRFSSREHVGEYTGMLGRPTRTIDPDAGHVIRGKQSNLVLIFDDRGLYLLQDRPSEEVVSISFVYEPEDALFEIGTSYVGRVEVNGVSLHRGMLERDLPVKGEVTFRATLHRWSSRCGSVFATLATRRPLDDLGRRRGSHRLISVSLDFLNDAELAHWLEEERRIA